MCARGLACENVRMIEESKGNDAEEGKGKGREIMSYCFGPSIECV